MKHCHSCAVPLDIPEFKGPAEDICAYCADEQGVLKSRQEVKNAVTGWFMEWHPEVSAIAAQQRAEHYMLSMPAWAE